MFAVAFADIGAFSLVISSSFPRLKSGDVTRIQKIALQIRSIKNIKVSMLS